MSFCKIAKPSNEKANKNGNTTRYFCFSQSTILNCDRLLEAKKKIYHVRNILPILIYD
jgi:hypothetical protein